MLLLIQHEIGIGYKLLKYKTKVKRHSVEPGGAFKGHTERSFQLHHGDCHCLKNMEIA